MYITHLPLLRVARSDYNNLPCADVVNTSWNGLAVRYPHFNPP